MIEEVDEDKSGRLEFEEFIILAAKFIVEEDEEAREWLICIKHAMRTYQETHWLLLHLALISVQKELKEAFRLYDKEGNGFIPTSCLKEILRELDDQLSNSDLDGMIQEIDSDGSGTVDFDGECLGFNMIVSHWGEGSEVGASVIDGGEAYKYAF